MLLVFAISNYNDLVVVIVDDPVVVVVVVVVVVLAVVVVVIVVATFPLATDKNTAPLPQSHAI